MQTRWFKGLDKQEEKDLRASLLAAELAFKRLAKLLEDDMKSSESLQHSESLYESPSWAYQQADAIGQQRAFRKILRLISKEK